jgi:hypothetical protein
LDELELMLSDRSWDFMRFTRWQIDIAGGDQR